MIHKFLQSKVGIWLRKKLEYKNEELENIHNGESCYIFGDGHSIKYYDLSNFNDKIGIACNHFPFHKDFKKTNVKYSVLIEPYYFMPFFDKVVKKRKVQTIFSFNPISFHYRKLIKTHLKIKFFVSLSNYFFLSGKNVHFLYKNILFNKTKADTILCEKFNCDAGVLKRAISLAVYMGFKEIYLVGCDYLFYPRQSGHWYEYGSPIISYKYDKEYIDTFINELKKQKIDFKLIAPYELESNIEIVKYSDLFNKQVVYKENNYLLENSTLNFFAMQKTMNL